MKKYLPSLQSAMGTLALSVICASGSVHAQSYEDLVHLSTPVVSTEFDLITPSIVGGDPVAQGDRTYQVSLGNGGCGGTIIADQWILTAAHCISSGWPGSVRVGVNRLSSNQGETHNVVETIVHEGYSSANTGNDIALLKVSGLINPNYIRAKLPTSAVMQAAGSPGDMVVASGWGALSSGGASSDILQEVTVPVVSNATCNSAAAYNGGINNTMICAGYQQGGKDSCQGDSGGPLVATYQNEIYNVGVVSWGQGCAAPNKYGVYARTSKFVDWINSKIGGPTDPTDPPTGGNVLQNGVAKTGLSASTGRDIVFTMNVPAGATNINFVTSGGSGDADMYVKFGSAPTDSIYDCRPYKGGNNESCSGSSTGGTYYVRLKAYQSFSGVSLTGSYTGGGTPPGGGNPPISDQLNNISVTGGQWKRYTKEIPAGYSDMTISISGGYGDADLYIRHGAQSTLSSYDCRPYKGGNNETCSFTAPAGGTWYIDLYGYQSASGVTLNLQANP
jgi:secreted trypsin-like serine protease